jgi:fatty-acyl-CoA synthase
MRTDWVSYWANVKPHSLALKYMGSEETWTYSQLNRDAQRMACQLKVQFGIHPKDRIAVCAQNHAETVLLFLASLKIGAILVPINCRLSAVEVRSILDDCEPKMVLVQDEFAELFGTPKTTDTSKLTQANVLNYRLLSQWRSQGDQACALELGFEEFQSSLQEEVMLLYTSGSTGKPKAVCITHQMLLFNTHNTQLSLTLTESDHTLHFAPLFHTGGWNVLLTPLLMVGGSQTLFPSFQAEHLLLAMQQEKPTLLFGVPTMLQMLASHPLFETMDFSYLRFWVVGGAPMPVSLIKIWESKGVSVRQGYGLTEVGPNCFSLHQNDSIRKMGSIGRPNFHLEAKVVREDGTKVDPNETGELWLRGPVVTPGYWNNEEQTRLAFGPNGWFKTGDFATYDEENFFTIVDRKKNMFISGGENVYPGEVERCLGNHPAIQDILVVARKDEKWGEVGHGVYTLKDGQAQPLLESELRAFCRERLASFKIPKYWTKLAEIPKNATGKWDRMQLQSFLSQNHPTT